MKVRVGTFNLNNLFSRYNFQARVDTIPDDETGGVKMTFEKGDIHVRTFVGRLVRAKDAKGTVEIAARIIKMNADVLAVQEVEHIGILRQFNKVHLNNLYPHIALIEGNDQRLIDVGILSKLPLGSITSHQTATHPEHPNKRVFGRDLLQVEILNPKGTKKLFTLYNTHMKSHFVPFNVDPVQGAINANKRRQRQAETISRLISRMERKNSRFVLTGDMNDPPNSEFLTPMLIVDGQPLTNALANPQETRPSKKETANQGLGPQSKAWTHRYNPPGPETPRYELFDHIWLSPALAGKFSNPMIDRRTKHGGDGSDHDPAWIDLDL